MPRIGTASLVAVKIDNAALAQQFHRGLDRAALVYEELVEGGHNGGVHRLVGRTKWPNLVLKRGITQNDALFAWLAFTFLAAKNGRTIDPTTAVGEVIDEMVPPGGEALRTIPVGARITAINGRPVASWNDVTDRLANSPESELRLEQQQQRPELR